MMPTEEEYKQAINDILDDIDTPNHDYEMPDELKKRLLKLAGRDHRWLCQKRYLVDGKPPEWQEKGPDDTFRAVRTFAYYWDESDQTGEPDKFETRVYCSSGGGYSSWTETAEDAMACHNNAIERAKQEAEENARQTKPTT